MKPSKLKQVVIVCDGSSLGNQTESQRRAAAVAILDYQGKRKILGEYLGAKTNQQAEIVAACLGLEALKQPCQVTVISDSEYLIHTMNGKYKRRSNHEYWLRLDRAAAPHRVTWTWTRGHAGHELQEKCDRAARLIAATGRVDPDQLQQILENG
ncbi:MAG: RNase H family protein [Acidobacteriota bacterium]|nr:reverse transcriptase-like protein [Blastocatellia bacterium]MDW8239224.1 RNase H family protein [Acidobacteriota bacterium]